MLKSLCCNNSNKLIFVNLNLNSIRNKFKFRFVRIRGYILEVIYSGFNELLIHDFNPPYSFDHDSKGGGIML